MDAIIIGAGISGLYLAIELLKKNKKVLVIEKSKRLGGRLYTRKFLNYTYESGAGRFSDKDKLLFNLIKSYKLEKKIIPIGSHDKRLDNYYKKIQLSLLTNKKDLSNISTLEYLQSIFSKDEIADFASLYGYDGEIIRSNAICGLNILLDDYETKSYHVLSGGLEQLIPLLYNDIILNGGTIHLSTNVSDIGKIGDNFIVNTSKGQFQSKKLVLAIPPDRLKALKPHKVNLDFISYIYPNPLLRIYFLYNEPQLQLSGLKKQTSNTDIRMIIPINSHIIMISYTDDSLANKWNHLYKTDKELFYKKMLTEFYDNTGIKLMKPDEIAFEYWKNGIHLWKPGFDQIKNYNKIIQPVDSLFLSNEAYSTHQGWIEGSLIIAKDVAKIL